MRLRVGLLVGACCVLGVAVSCGGSDGKKADSAHGDGGVGGEQEPGSEGGSAGTGGTTDGGAPTAGSLNEGGVAGEGAASEQGGAGGEGAVSDPGGAGGEVAVSGAGGGGGEGGAGACVCDPQVDYSAASGVLPSDESCVPWTFVDSANPEVPSFVAGALRIESSANAENMYFHQLAATLSFPEEFVFEARMKLVSGAGSASPARGPAALTFAYGAQRMTNMVTISPTEVFILSGENTKGTAFAFDPTDDFHTYRIVADTVDNTFELFIDDELAISGVTFATTAPQTVQFGETSIYGYGVSEWQFVRHNAFGCAGGT